MTSTVWEASPPYVVYTANPGTCKRSGLVAVMRGTYNASYRNNTRVMGKSFTTKYHIVKLFQNVKSGTRYR